MATFAGVKARKIHFDSFIQELEFIEDTSYTIKTYVKQIITFRRSRRVVLIILAATAMGLHYIIL